MKFMLTIYGNSEAWDALTAADIDERDRVHKAVHDELRASGELLASGELDNDVAKVVRTERGTVSVSDGPFTEAKEMVGGYYLVDCTSLDRAVEIAGRFTEAEYAPIEVRGLV
ncbi:hypothetical protein ASC63_12250 [Leifsonia sp. Root112D2]|nr:hypothetical protein ASC63_12250 [Leifsonia sp. Root112D2]